MPSIRRRAREDHEEQRPGTRVMLEVERNKLRRPVELTLLPRSQWAGAEPAP